MNATVSWKATLARPVVVLGIAGIVAVAAVWAFVFFLPQSRKLTTLQQEKISLDATVSKDNARLQRLRAEQHHVGEIRAMYRSLESYIPPTEELYTYVHTIAAAAKAAGVTVASLNPGQLAPVTGTPYSAIPVTAMVKGTFAHIKAFLRNVYRLPRLTDVNSLTLSGGGPHMAPTSPVSATFQLAIFSRAKPPAPPSSTSAGTTSAG